MALTKKQKEALFLLTEGENIFLSGEGGTGKSFVIEKFTDYLEENNIPYVVAAPTGLAALKVGGATLHRTFKLSIDLGEKDISLKNVEKAKVIIIDEISMCRRDIFQTIARALKDFENPLEEYNIERERAICRKKQIVLVGDFFQLPPFLGKNDKILLDKVKNGEIDEYFYKDILNLEQTIYPFQCEEWEHFNFKSIVLDEVVRQKDKNYVDNLNLIRKGDTKGLEFIKKESSKEPVKEGIYLTARNKDADDLNTDNLNKINNKAYTYYAEEEGIVADSEKPVADKLVLKKGARVMCVVNIQDKDKKDKNEEREDFNTGGGIVNGMCGTVTSLSNNTVTVEFDDGQSYCFEKYKWSIKGFKKVIVDEGGEKVEKTIMDEIGSYRQIPLKLAWAITIHKSQGQSYEAVNLDPRCFAEGQLYVALSRAKNIEKLYLTKQLRKTYLKTSEVVKEFYEKIEAEKDYIEVDFKEVSESIKTAKEEKFEEVEMEQDIFETKVEEVSITTETEEEYVSIKVPRSLKEMVLGVLHGDDIQEIDILKTRIESLERRRDILKARVEQLEAELEKANRRRSKISKDKEQEILKLREQGLGMNKIAKAVGVGDGTVRRVLKDYNVK